MKGKALSWAQFLEAYVRPSGDITYFREWSGFNVPRKVYLEWFHSFDTDVMTDSEMDMFWKVVDPTHARIQYIIGTVENDQENTLAHELAHARYALDMEYANWMYNALRRVLIPFGADVMLKGLEDAGYHDPSVWTDELIAYLLTSDLSELLEMFPGVERDTLLSYQHSLQQAAKEYDERVLSTNGNRRGNDDEADIPSASKEC